jgi:hypothetical protein
MGAEAGVEARSETPLASPAVWPSPLSAAAACATWTAGGCRRSRAGRLRIPVFLTDHAISPDPSRAAERLARQGPFTKQPSAYAVSQVC